MIYLFIIIVTLIKKKFSKKTVEFFVNKTKPLNEPSKFKIYKVTFTVTYV